MYGISVDNSHGGWGIDNCGIIIGAPGASTPTPCGVTVDHKVATGIDFSNVIFTDSFLKGPGGAGIDGRGTCDGRTLARPAPSSPTP